MAILDRTLFNPRLGAALQMASNRPDVARMGADQLARLDDQRALEEQRLLKAEELKRGTFMKLFEVAAKNGADEDTLSKLAMAAGIEADPQVLGGIAKPKDMSLDRVKALGSNAQKYDPASLDAFAGSGRFSDLRLLPEDPKARTVKSLSPGSQLVDAEGNILAENKNVRPTKAGFKQEVRAEVMARNAVLRDKISGSDRLSDRLKLARAKIDENVAGGISTPTTGDKLKSELDKRREALVRYDNAAESALSILDKNPTAVTVGADTAKAMQSLGTNIKGLLSLIPGVDYADLDIGEFDWTEKLNQYAGDNAELRTTMFNLALQLAVADGLASGKLTNQQIGFALDNIGASGRSPKSMRRKLVEVRKRVASSLDIALDGALEDFSDLDRPDPTKPPEGVSPEEWAVMTPEERAAFQ